MYICICYKQSQGKNWNELYTLLLTESDIRLTPADKAQQRASLLLEFQNSAAQQHQQQCQVSGLFSAFREPIESIGELCILLDHILLIAQGNNTFSLYGTSRFGDRTPAV